MTWEPKNKLDDEDVDVSDDDDKDRDDDEKSKSLFTNLVSFSYERSSDRADIRLVSDPNPT